MFSSFVQCQHFSIMCHYMHSYTGLLSSEVSLSVLACMYFYSSNKVRVTLLYKHLVKTSFLLHVCLVVNASLHTKQFPAMPSTVTSCSYSDNKWRDFFSFFGGGGFTFCFKICKLLALSKFRPCQYDTLIQGPYQHLREKDKGELWL